MAKQLDVSVLVRLVDRITGPLGAPKISSASGH